jgi:hypothetical protein
MRILIVMLVTSLFLFVSTAQADSFRCGSSVVSTGETKIDVIIKCGRPDYSEVTSVSLSNYSATKVETFYYNCGEGRFVRILTFYGSDLVGIRSGGNYGTGPSRCE